MKKQTKDYNNVTVNGEVRDLTKEEKKIVRDFNKKHGYLWKQLANTHEGGDKWKN